MNPIVEFYSGPRVREIWGWPDERLEAVHDFIQWMFPLREPSAFQPGAPVLDDATVAAFHKSVELKNALRTSFERMLAFYGLRWSDGEVTRVGALWWLTPGNHNLLRLTRILKSLRILGLEAESRALFTCLRKIYEEHPDSVSARTFQFWSETQAQ